MNFSSKQKTAWLAHLQLKIYSLLRALSLHHFYILEQGSDDVIEWLQSFLSQLNFDVKSFKAALSQSVGCER